jgi:spore coat polysaccharide biosynthesis protein SpsF (cytidylyltransferase family)
MIDLSIMTATELQQMLTNIYNVASAYTDEDLEQCTKLERITIMFDTDAAEKLTLLNNDPEEYFKQKYSQEPAYTEGEAIKLITKGKDDQQLNSIESIIDHDRPAYPPQTYERITKAISHYRQVFTKTL